MVNKEEEYRLKLNALEQENKRLRAVLNSEKGLKKIEYLEAIVHSLPDIVFLIDDKGTYLDILTDKEALLVKERDFLLGKNFADVLPPEVTEIALNGIKKVLDTGVQTVIEYSLEINHQTKWFEGHISKVKQIDSNNLIFWVTDVTNRRYIQRRIEASEYKLKRAQQTARLAYFEWNLENDETYFSEQLNDLLGVSISEQITMRKYLGMLNSNDRAVISKSLREEIFKNKKFDFEYRLDLNGEKCYHIINCELIEDDQNPSYIFGIIQDVTQMRHLENERLEKMEEKNAMLNAIPDMMFIQDKNGVFIDFHAPGGEYKNLLVQPDHFLGKSSLEVLPPDIATENLQKVKQVVRTRQHVIHEYQLNLNGRHAYFESRLVPGVGETALSIVRDITAKKKAELELVKARMLAEESDRLKSAFLANMSHEIRTPMNGVIGFAELLLQDDIPQDEKNEYFLLIEKNNHQLLQLIDDIIDISKIEAKVLKIHKIDFNINDLLIDLERLYLKEIDMSSKPIDIEFKGLDDKQQGWIFTDKSRLMQILQNLITNAIKFTEAGKISIDTKVENHKLIFKVKDTGIGIPELSQKQIFERFRRLENTADKVYRGTGLGLAVTKGLVELLGGSIIVHSIEGEGSEFIFDISYQSGKMIENNINKLEEWTSLNGLDILIVEDEETSFAYLFSIFKKNNANVFRAKTGYEAIEMVKRQNIDLILMDIRLPELNGYDATRYIKKLAPDIPIIAQTAFAMADDEIKAKEAGCDDYVTKPISSYLLLNKIKNLLDN
jgi:PAS domain S-box-containing protein